MLIDMMRLLDEENRLTRANFSAAMTTFDGFRGGLIEQSLPQKSQASRASEKEKKLHSLSTANAQLRAN